MGTNNFNYVFTCNLEAGSILSTIPVITIQGVLVRQMMSKILIIIPRDVFDNYKSVNLACRVIESNLNRSVDTIPYTVTTDKLVFELYDCNYNIKELKELHFSITCNEYIGPFNKEKKSMVFAMQRFYSTVIKND